MKKLVALLLTVTLTLSLTACGGGKTAGTTKDDTEGKTARPRRARIGILPA